VVGVECGEVMMRLAREADPEHRDAYLDGVAQDLPLPDADRDVVVFSYSLHHVPPEAMLDALGEAHRVLRPGGLLYVVEPVAAGPGHEIIRVVDDETAVRGHAQRALARADEVGFVPAHATTYTSRMVLPDAATLAERVVGVDPQRRERMEQRREEFVTRFETLATPVEGGYALDQENRVAVFRKP
jgi:ubiquinone/menaquinone biosynthesis C-methylase UbiE